MTAKLDRYKADLEELVARGDLLEAAMQFAYNRSGFLEALQDADESMVESITKRLPTFTTSYQEWYSEAKALIRQLLPDRIDDFVRHYEKPRSRKAITFENYVIEDALQGLTMSKPFEAKNIADPSAAIPRFQQQLAILKAVERRFDSSLFDILQLAQADLFDSEIEAAEAVLRVKHIRAAGVIAGVVLESHLAQVCANHQVMVRRKNPTISDYNDALKKANAIDVPQWRFNQHLGDIRNLCGHRKDRDPSHEEVAGMIAGVRRVVKTLF